MFCVRPIIGVLKPNSSQVVSIILEKSWNIKFIYLFNILAYEKIFQSERFLVSSILASSFEPSIESLKNFSKLLTDLSPSNVFQSKINCFIKNKDELQKEDFKSNKKNFETLIDKQEVCF